MSRVADRSSEIRAKLQGRQSSGQSRRRTPRRTSWRSTEIVWVDALRVDPIFAVPIERCGRNRGTPQKYDATFSENIDELAIVRGAVVSKQPYSISARRALHPDRVLDRHGKPIDLAQRASGGTPRI